MNFLLTLTLKGGRTDTHTKKLSKTHEHKNLEISRFTAQKYGNLNYHNAEIWKFKNSKWQIWKFSDLQHKN